MPTALWIAHVHVTDAEAYGRYAKGAGPAIAAHGGVFLARGGRYVQLEGNDRARNVVARFPQPGGGGGMLPLGRLSGGAGACQGRRASAT
jgi:uncharacterized protein (DUF1330 family)